MNKQAECIIPPNATSIKIQRTETDTEIARRVYGEYYREIYHELMTTNEVETSFFDWLDRNTAEDEPKIKPTSWLVYENGEWVDKVKPPPEER